MESFRHFTKNNEGLLTFTFYQAVSFSSKQFLVIASDFNMQFQMFNMEEQEGKWKILEPEKLLEWILPFEEELSEVLAQKHAYA